MGQLQCHLGDERMTSEWQSVLENNSRRESEPGQAESSGRHTSGLEATLECTTWESVDLESH